MSSFSSSSAIENLLQVIARLRHPTEGCPWDLKQTHQSLGPYLLEEAYETIEALALLEHDENSFPFREELGDVLLQVVLHSQLASEAGTFDFEDVCQILTEKLIRRHPHVFGAQSLDDADAVVRQWEAIKQLEKQNNPPTLALPRKGGGDIASAKEERLSENILAKESILANIAKSQPALSRALDTSKKAVKVGFEWPNMTSLWECVMSEYDEFRAEIPTEAFDTPSLSELPVLSLEKLHRLEDEMGDILFATVNLARQFKIDPEIALTRATAKFTRRFQQMESLILDRADEGQSLKDAMATLDFERWDDLWREAKKLLDVEAARK